MDSSRINDDDDNAIFSFHLSTPSGYSKLVPEDAWQDSDQYIHLKECPKCHEKHQKWFILNTFSQAQFQLASSVPFKLNWN